MNSYHWVIMEKISVKEFIEELKMNENDSNNIKILTTIGEQDNNWITKEDVSYLFTLINSEMKAKCIMQSYSSYISSVKPSLSDHAILLIETYKNQLQFPNKLNHCTIYTSEKKEELINWWIEEKDK